MILTDKLKQEIDGMSIYDLLYRQRFAPIGDEIFQGDSGTYFMKRMNELRSQDNGAYVRASKDMGWS